MSDNLKKPALRSATWPFIMSLVTAASFVALFYAFKSSAASSFDATIAALPSVKIFGSGSANTIRGYFVTYGALAGVIFGLLYAILSYVTLGIFAIVRLTKTPFGVTSCCLLSSLPFVWLGYAMSNQSNKNTAIAAGAVFFLGAPLMYAGLVVAGVSLVLFALSFKYGKAQ